MEGVRHIIAQDTYVAPLKLAGKYFVLHLSKGEGIQSKFSIVSPGIFQDLQRAEIFAANFATRHKLPYFRDRQVKLLSPLVTALKGSAISSPGYEDDAWYLAILVEDVVFVRGNIKSKNKVILQFLGRSYAENNGWLFSTVFGECLSSRAERLLAEKVVQR